MGMRSRRKGAAWEREVAEIMRSVFDNPEIRRGLQSQGGVVPDVDGCPLWIECKVGERPNLWRALKQAQDDSATSTKIPVVIAKRHATEGRTPTKVAVLDLEDFTALVRLARQGIESIEKGRS